MTNLRMGTIESKFAEIIWNNEPIPSPELVKLTAISLDWKKSTTYTVLKKLCLKGIFQNEKGTVKSVMSKDDYYSMLIEEILDEGMNNSLSEFIQVFIKRKNFSDNEIDEIIEVITKK